MSVASFWIDHSIDLQVFFIKGKQNTIADALSCHSFNFIWKLVLDVSIQHFTPPSSPSMLVMGACHKWTSASPCQPDTAVTCIGQWGHFTSSGPLCLGLLWNNQQLTLTPLLLALTSHSVTCIIFLLNLQWKDYASISYTCLISSNQHQSNPTYQGFVLNLSPFTWTFTLSALPNSSLTHLLAALNFMAHLQIEKELSPKVTCVMVWPPFPFSAHPWPPPTPSASSLCLPPLLHSNSEVYSCNLYNYVAPTLRLTMDQYQTCSDLVPMPRASIYIPFLHLSYLPDPFSLTIMGNYSFLV